MLASQVLPLTFDFAPRPEGRPLVVVVKPDSNERWLA
jgi:hypothetical protein